MRTGWTCDTVVFFSPLILTFDLLLPALERESSDGLEPFSRFEDGVDEIGVF